MTPIDPISSFIEAVSSKIHNWRYANWPNYVPDDSEKLVIDMETGEIMDCAEYRWFYGRCLLQPNERIVPPELASDARSLLGFKGTMFGAVSKKDYRSPLGKWLHAERKKL